MKQPSISVILRVALALLLSGCAIQGDSIAKTTTVSGLQPGDDIVPWNPLHDSGPDAGTNACPVCTYGERPAVEIFTKDGPDVGKLAEQLDALVVRQQARQLKGFLIVLDTTPQRIKQLAAGLNVSHIGICHPDPATLSADLKAYKINPAADNTVIIYKDYKVASNFVDLRPDAFAEVEDAVSRLH